MLCPHCAAETDPTATRCRNCLVTVQSPAIWQGARVFAVRGLGLAAVIAIAVASLVSLVTSLSPLLIRVALGSPEADPGLLDAAYAFDSAGYLTDAVFFLIAGVLVCNWLWRARKNVDAFPESRASYSAGWAFGGWALPIGNLFIPCVMVFQVARESLHRRWVRPVVAAWWAAYLLRGLVAVLLAPEEPDLAASDAAYAAYLDGLTAAYLAGAFLTAVAGYLLATLIFTVSRAQTGRIERGLAAHVPVVGPAAASGTITG